MFSISPRLLYSIQAPRQQLCKCEAVNWSPLFSPTSTTQLSPLHPLLLTQQLVFLLAHRPIILAKSLHLTLLKHLLAVSHHREEWSQHLAYIISLTDASLLITYFNQITDFLVTPQPCLVPTCVSKPLDLFHPWGSTLSCLDSNTTLSEEHSRPVLFPVNSFCFYDELSSFLINFSLYWALSPDSYKFYTFF